jgi:hypothetical protein
MSTHADASFGCHERTSCFYEHLSSGRVEQAITLRANLLEGCDFRAIALIDAVALSPWGSPFYHLVQDHVGVLRQMPAYMHEAIVAAYVRDATYVPMDDETLGP